MATQGTPFEGRDNIVGPMLYTALTSAAHIQMILYENAANSLGESTVRTDINYPSETGYANMTLGTGWTFTNGVFQYDNGTPDNIVWTNSGAGAWSNPIVGAAMQASTDYSGGTIYLLHFKDFANSITLGAGESIEVDINTLVGS